MNEDKLVSVIITTKNEAQTIGRLIQSIKEQNYPNKEIILVDNNSEDKTVYIAKKRRIKVYLYGPERSSQRNYGAKAAKGEYFLFLDADMELSPNVLKECIEAFTENPNIGGLSIPEKSKAITFWEKVKAFERSFYNEKGDPVTDAARFFKKNVFWESGGYDETITGPEDWDLPETIREMGYKIGRIKAHIYHYERVPSPFLLARKKFYYALSAYRYLKKHDIPIVSAKTVYFLRPVFYKNWIRIILHPVMSLAMLVLLSAELFGGGLGYLSGRLNDYRRNIKK